jgi:signal transduction histidine kinase/CheY-like chemotaxis protein
VFHRYLPSFFINTVMKSITAIVSFTTAVVLIQLIPIALRVPSMQQLEDEIKERKSVQEKMVEVEKARDKQRREAEEAKNLFFANMSHEIRTPLSGVIGLTDLLSRSTSLGEEERELVRQISASGELLLQIVNDVLDVAKLDEGKVELEEIEFSPSECIYSMESVLRVKAAERGLKLIINMSDEFANLKVIGDSARLKQALINLGGNAIKFTNHGYVKISCNVVERRDETTTVAVDIEDTGIGIPEDRMGRLFKTYTQVDASYSRNFGGTGLGLYIAKEFVKLLGGSISVRSKVGEGTTFTVTLPLSVSKRKPEPEPPSHAFLPDSFRGVTDKAILVVDDNAINRSVALKMLAQFGFTHCDKAENGEQALLFMKANHYDLVLMDCMMPVMDGYQATKEWRRYEREHKLPHITIVGVTANALKQDEALCLRSGMDKYARKPLSRQALGEILANSFCTA